MEEPELLRALGARLRARRGGMTQRRLAHLANVEMSTVSRIEHGQTDPSLLRVRRIATALQMSLEELFHDLETGVEPISEVAMLAAEVAILRSELSILQEANANSRDARLTNEIAAD